MSHFITTEIHGDINQSLFMSWCAHCEWSDRSTTEFEADMHIAIHRANNT